MKKLPDNDCNGEIEVNNMEERLSGSFRFGGEEGR